MSLKKFAPLFLLVAGLLFSATLYSYFNTKEFIKRSDIVPGEVINLIERKDSDNESTYAPEVQFVYNGKKIVFVSTTSSNPPSYFIGEEIEILIDPDNSQNFKINSFGELWMIPFFLGIFGIAVFSIGAFYQWGKQIKLPAH